MKKWVRFLGCTGMIIFLIAEVLFCCWVIADFKAKSGSAVTNISTGLALFKGSPDYRHQEEVINFMLYRNNKMMKYFMVSLV